MVNGMIHRHSMFNLLCTFMKIFYFHDDSAYHKYDTSVGNNLPTFSLWDLGDTRIKLWVLFLTTIVLEISEGVPFLLGSKSLY